MDRTTWLLFGIVAIVAILVILALRKMPPSSGDILILLLAVAAVTAAGFLWIEYTIPGLWPPWIGLPPEGHH